METEEFTAEEKCENLMNIVVESRKRFGKMCVDYEQKASLIENKILNMRLETISNFQCKPKHPIPVVDMESAMKDSEEFMREIHNKQKRLENIRKLLRNTQEVVQQIRKDQISKKAREPLSSEAMLVRAKRKFNAEVLEQ